ncbi:MAG: ATP-binding cassette domain-containing protein [Alphaproteobacteria bacterium]|nr:ATP-binding cassette domain-containing protein [Alphaproteobacteria bacterium]
MYKYIKPIWFRALCAVLVTFPVGMMDSVIAWTLKPYMDVVMIEKNLESGWYVPMLIIGFSFIQSALNYSAGYLNSWVGLKISNSIKIELFQKLVRYEASFFDKNTSGTILYRFNNDVDSACAGLLNNLKLFTTRIFSSLSLIIVLFINSWKLAIVAIIVLLTALYPLTTIRKKIDDIMLKNVSTSAGVITFFSEAFNGNRIITSYNLYDYLNNKFKTTLATVFSLGMKMVQRTGLLSPMMHFIIAIGIAVIIWMGSYLIFSGDLTPGGFVSFITALLLLYQPIKSIGNDFNAMQLAMMAMERVFSLLKVEPAIKSSPNAIMLNDVKNKIEYKNICFEYQKNHPVLSNINLDINVGETVAFVGNSGGGKTTMVNLLPRFYEPKSGKILIDGTDISRFELDSLRDKISIVFQDNFLFDGTIRDNIVLGNIEATKSQIDLAVHSACLDEFIASLDKGLETRIGERGVLLSGGQKQRVAIARAFLKNAPIVILDEATSALDNKSEAVVQRAINNLMKDRTVLIIAHRLSTVRNANKIVVVDHGNIVEIGNHNELLKQKGTYYNLYNSGLTTT